MSFSFILFLTLVGFAAIGILLNLSLMPFHRGWAAVSLGPWIKVGVELVQFFSGAAALGAGFATADAKPEWFPAAVAGAVSLGAWKLFQVLLDWLRSSEVASLNKDLKDAIEEGLLYSDLVTAFHEPVKWQLGRVTQACETPPPPTPAKRIDRILQGLSCEERLEELLEAMASFFADRKDDNGPAANLRAGLYLEDVGHMKPLFALSLNDPGYSPFRSYERSADSFRLVAEERASQIVLCVNQQALLIVEDCEMAARAGQFFFMNNDQKHYLKSMLAYKSG